MTYENKNCSIGDFTKCTSIAAQECEYKLHTGNFVGAEPEV